MPDPVTGVMAGATVIGGVTQSRSASRAANAQVESNAAAIAEQRRQFDQVQRLLQPYTAAGTPALQSLMNLAGLGQTTTDWGAYARANPAIMEAYQAQYGQQGTAPAGGAGAPYGVADGIAPWGTGAYGPGALNFLGGFNPAAYGDATGNLGFDGRPDRVYTGGAFGGGAAGGTPGMSLEQFAQQYYNQNGGDLSQFTNDPQARAVAQIENSPMFQALARQGEEAILQNASATGGLRGGNTQGALARFRPQLLNQFIEQQYGRQAGIAALGQQSAAGVGTAGLQTGGNISNLMAASGAAQAAGIGAQGQILGSTIGNLGGLIAGAVQPNPYARLAGSANSTINANPSIF